MARAHKVNRARSDIYTEGKRVKHVIQRGKRKGTVTTKVDRTRPANKQDKVLIRKGEPYYWWQFMNGPKTISRTRPKPSQLTQSEFLSQALAIQEQVEAISEFIQPEEREDIATELEGCADELETLASECENKRSNMPEQLQDAETGQLLETRAEKCNELADELRTAAEEVRGTEPEEDAEGVDEVEGGEDDTTTEPELLCDIGDILSALDWSFE